MRVAAIVVGWNSEKQLPALLDSLEAQDHPDLEVVVVDNASVDGTLTLAEGAAARADQHPVRIVRNRTNRGFCGGVNDGLAVLGHDVEAVLFVNPDVVLAPDLVACCVARLAHDPDCGSVQPLLRRAAPGPDGATIIDTTGHVLTSARLILNRGEGEVDAGSRPAGAVFGASGACVLHRRAMLDDVAWSDGQVLTEELVAYFDDVELDWRARVRGWTAWYEPTATAVHERGGAGPRRTPQVEALNLGKRPQRGLPAIVATTMLKATELLLSVPSAVPGVLAQLRHWPAAGRRRRELLARARLSLAQVAAIHAQRFRWRPWVATWWRRVRGRAPGVTRPVAGSGG